MTTPFVSVVIPVHNGRQWLDVCLPPLFNQTYPQDRYEIIMVDDGSTDGTADVADAKGSAWTGHFRVIRQHNQGPGVARTRGIEAAQGDLIAFIDSDCEAYPNWLTDFVAEATRQQVDGLGGRLTIRDLSNRLWRYYEFSRFHKQRIRNSTVDYLITANALFHRDALLAVGGFETTGRVVSEDVDLCYRLQRAGYILGATESVAVIHHGDPKTLRQFWKRLRVHGRASVALARSWPEKRRPTVEFIRHLGAIILAPYLAFKAAQRDSFRWFFWYWLCAVVQHTAFCVGMLDALRTPSGSA